MDKSKIYKKRKERHEQIGSNKKEGDLWYSDVVKWWCELGVEVERRIRGLKRNAMAWTRSVLR